MIPNKELQDLARALSQTAEFTEMIKHRWALSANMQLSRQMQYFEKEQERIISANGTAEEISGRIKRLLADNKALLDKEEVKNYLSSTRAYQNMMSDCFAALYKAMDAYIYRR